LIEYGFRKGQGLVFGAIWVSAHPAEFI